MRIRLRLCLLLPIVVALAFPACDSYEAPLGTSELDIAFWTQSETSWNLVMSSHDGKYVLTFTGTGQRPPTGDLDVLDLQVSLLTNGAPSICNRGVGTLTIQGSEALSGSYAFETTGYMQDVQYYFQGTFKDAPKVNLK